MFKTCRKCEITKPLDQFYKHKRSKGGYRNQCKECRDEKAKEWNNKNRHLLSGYARKWESKNPLKKVCYSLRTLYGITLRQRDEMIDSQGGKCPVCLVEFSKEVSPCVDHDHTTGEIRGILCMSCNFAEGLLKNTDSVLRLFEYLTSK
jgi:hypothetical protein